MEYKRSYKGFVIWVILFLAVMIGSIFIPLTDIEMHLRIDTNICTIMITLLTFIIYKTQNIYWFNGIEYEEALKAGESRRKAYAFKHFKYFSVLSIIVLVFSIIMYITSQSPWIDFIIGMLGLIITAISTIKIKL